MPKPTAIKLSWKTVPKICNHLNLSESDVKEELQDELHKEVTWYYITDYVSHLLTKPMPYAILMESTFLEQFASVPPGIEDHFVPVTQVKD